MARPLTKLKKNGDLYLRPTAVESQIVHALRQDEATLECCLRIQDKRSPEHLRSECLVHLVREGVRSGNEFSRNRVLEVLLSRCSANLKRTIRDSVPNAGDVRDSVLSEFGELLGSDARDGGCEELDFYECRFGQAFAALRKDVLERELRHVNRNVELPEEKEFIGCYEEVMGLVTAAFQSPDFETGQLREELNNAIKELPREERKAVILHCVLGYKVESLNPDEVTVATRCKCTGRTVRNRLSRAAEKLSLFREDI